MYKVIDKIQPRTLTDEQMEIIGFVKTPNGWNYEVNLEEYGDTKLLVNIQGENLKIDVYNEYTNGEKFRYNYLKAHNIKPELEYIGYICNRIEAELMYLQDNGVIIGYKKGMNLYE